MTRDTFTGVDVVDGDTLIVTLILHLSDEFTNNFGWFLMYLFRYIIDGDITTGTGNGYWNTDQYRPFMIISTGTAISQRVYYSAGSIGFSDYGTVADGLPTGGSTSVAVGSSNQQSGNMQYNLYSPVGIRTAVSPAPSIDGNNIIIIADCVMTGASTLREACLYYTYCAASGVYYPIMFWRVTFDPVTIAAGHAVEVQFTLYL
jgi:hypothetical protein